MADSSCRDLSDDIKTPRVSRRPTYITHLPANARSCRNLSDDVSRLLKGFSVIDSSLKYDRFRNLKNKIYPLLYQNIE